MRKIAMIGAGGVMFAQSLIKDILLDDVLRNYHVTLMDIDAGRLAVTVPCNEFLLSR